MSARNMLGTHYLDIYQPSSKITLEAWHEGDPLKITGALISLVLVVAINFQSVLSQEVVKNNLTLCFVLHETKRLDLRTL